MRSAFYALFYGLLVFAPFLGCAAQGVPFDPADSNSARDIGTDYPDLSTVRPDLSVPDLALSLVDSGDASMDLAMPHDLASVPDLAIACSNAIDCSSYLCVSGQCAPAYNDTCATAAQLVFVNGRADAESTLGLATNGNSPGDQSPTCSSDARTFGQDAIYYFDLLQTSTVLIGEWDPEMKGMLFPVLYIRNGTCDDSSAAHEVGCSSTAAGPNDTGQTLVNLAPGRYYVWADSRGYFPSTYNLSVVIQ